MSAKYECNINYIALKFGVRKRDISGGESIHLQMMVTSQQEVQTITQTSTGYKFGHNVNP